MSTTPPPTAALFAPDTSATGLAPAGYAAAFLPSRPPPPETLRIDLPVPAGDAYQLRIANQ